MSRPSFMIVCHKSSLSASCIALSQKEQASFEYIV
jgi:hypothetical protein